MAKYAKAEVSKTLKNLLDKIKLPAFLLDRRMRVIAAVMLGVAFVGIAVAAWIQPRLAFFLFIFLLVLFVVIFFALETISGNTSRYISNLSYRIKRGEQEALIRMPVGILLFDPKLNVQWANPFLLQYLDADRVIGRSLEAIDKDLAKLVAENQDSGDVHQVSWGDHQFDMIIQKSIGVVYLMDVTRYANLEKEAAGVRIVLGQIFLDNYDEIRQGLDDQTVTRLNSYVANKLGSWADQYGMFVKRVAADRYLLIGYVKALSAVEKDKFNILDVIREETSKQNLPLTLSVGIAYGEDNLAELADASQSNLDLALGRGGDQVVVRQSGEQARFYGGRTNPMEKRTRVRARMIAQALQELLKQADQVFIVGHKSPDMDSIGSALGLRRIAEMNNVEASVVIDPDHLHSDVERLMRAVGQDEMISPSIVTPEVALEMATEKSLLILVDHNKRSITGAPDLFDQLKNRLIIIDHHRRGEEFPDNPVLVYIEPYASSTSELITEMFEYQPAKARSLSKLEATAMLVGITVDTKNFSLRTGTRTFDAASYLRSVGADGLLAQEFLKENVDSFIQRNHLIDTIRMIAPKMALCTGEEDKRYDPVVAAQAADTMLTLNDIDASFVVVRRDDGNIGISARSLGNINVQRLMEKMGGGGHLSNAATQVKDKTIAETVTWLQEVIQDEIEDN